MGVKAALGKIRQKKPYVVTAKTGVLGRSLLDANDRELTKMSKIKSTMYWFKELKKNRVHALGIIKLGLDAEKSQQSLSLSLGLIFFHCELYSQGNFLRKKRSLPGYS